MERSFSFWMLLFSALSACYGQKNYTSHKLIGAYASSDEELEILRSIQYDEEVDFWSEPSSLFQKISILLSPEISKKIKDKLYASGIDYFEQEDNIQELIEKERNENDPLEQRSWPYPLNVYYSFEQLMKFIDEINIKFSNLTTAVTLGTTAEGNVIKGVKVSSGMSEKPAIWIDAGIHAREWVAPATALYILHHLVTDYDNEDTKYLVDNFDWYIIPMANPDGYKYSWTQDRMWRKNRASPPYSLNGRCKGADPNRNFDSHFGGVGTSDNPCSEIYRGHSAFSESESRAIRDGVLRIRSQLKAYISFHAYSQLWMCPYGHSRSQPAEYSDMIRALNVISGAVQAKHSQWYKVGTISTVIYAATGSSVDWVYDTVGVKYSFVAELRDTGRYGFILPRDQIIPTAEETLAGIKALVRHIKSEM